MSTDIYSTNDIITLQLESLNISAICKKNVNSVVYISEKWVGILKAYLTYLFVRYTNITSHKIKEQNWVSGRIKPGFSRQFLPYQYLPKLGRYLNST
jgi:hypothetical protein